MNTTFIKGFKKSRAFLFWIWKQEGTPAKRARGLAVGVFSGCFPFFGFQTFIGILLAGLVRGNYLLAVAGTWISNPLTYLPLYWFNYKVGDVFLGEGRDLHNLSELTKQQLFDQGLLFGSKILLGSSIVGLMTGLASGLASYIFFKSFSNQRKVY